MDDAKKILALIGAKSRVVPVLGVYVEMESPGFRLLVDVDNSRIPTDSLTDYRPEVGEPVWVFFVDEHPFMMGPARSKPSTGTVLGVVDDIVTVDTDIGTKDAGFIGDVPDIGDTVRLLWSEGPIVLGVPASVPPPPVAPPAPGGAEGIQLRDFYATDSGQYLSRWQNNTVRASDSVNGAWFYGTQVQDTIPDDAIIDLIQIYLPLQRELGVCRVGVHDYDSMPAGWTGSAAEVDLAPRGGWVALPNSFGDWFKVNGGGITVTSGDGDNQWAGTQADGQSGRLQIKYHIPTP